MKTIKKSGLVLIMLLVANNIFSQESSRNNSTSKTQKEVINQSIQNSNFENETPVIMEVENFVASKESFELGQNLSYSNAKRLKSLLYDANQPSLYYYTNGVKSFGDNPTNLYTDIISLGSLVEAKIPHTIELVRINIDNSSQLNSIIDLKLLEPFKKVK